MCILSVLTLLKVVGCYDHFFLDFWNFFNFAKPLNLYSTDPETMPADSLP